jgi:hypothetical protein
MNEAKEKYIDIVMAQEEEEKIQNSKKEEIKKNQENDQKHSVGVEG